MTQEHEHQWRYGIITESEPSQQYRWCECGASEFQLGGEGWKPVVPKATTIEAEWRSMCDAALECFTKPDEK